MSLEDLPDDVPEFDDDLDDADEWDEETLGLDWNDAEAQRLVRDVVPLGPGWTD